MWTPLCLCVFIFLFSRVHPAVCHRGSSKGAGRGRWRLLFRELHVRLFRGRGSGHGVVVRGGSSHPLGLKTGFWFLKNRNSVLYSYLNKTAFFFLQWNKDFYRCRKICSGISLNIYLYIVFHHHMAFPLPPLRAYLDENRTQPSFWRSSVSTVKAWVQSEQWDQCRGHEDWYPDVLFASTDPAALLL